MDEATEASLEGAMGRNSVGPGVIDGASPALTDDCLVRVYRKIREAKAEAKRVWEEQEKEFNRKMKTVSTELLRRCRERGQTGMQTADGTVYIAEEMKVSCSDWGIFYDFIKQHDALEMLEQRVKVGEVKNYMTAHGGELPPGLSVFREYEARVRKPTKRGEKALGDQTEE